MSHAVPAPRRSPRLVAYITATSVLALVGFVLAWWLAPAPTNLVALVALTGLGLLSEFLKERDVGARIQFSNLSIIVLAAIPLVGPVGAAVVGAVTFAVNPRPTPLIRRYFNSVAFLVLGTLGGSVYLLVGGARDLNSVTGAQSLVLSVALPLLLADVTQMVGNAVLIAGIMNADIRRPFRVTFLGMVGTSGPAYLGYGVVGFLLVVLWVPAGVGPFSAVLILAPLFVARWAFVQYGDEVRAHESALSALVTAVETKDPHSVGHSARLAGLVEWFVEPLGLSVQEVGALRFAAMLHDVGKVGLPTRIVRGEGDQTRADLMVLARHSESGVDLLRGVTFLEDSLDGIRHHHERWDGRGYPDGLAGGDIPLISRIIAVADGFDSLTVRRPGRDGLGVRDALLELRARSETQFDPAIVDALARVLERRTWEAGVVEMEDPPARAAYFDHDDPAASDLYARLVADVRPSIGLLP
ncbi:HD domain-containing phosphohydrolase [Dermatophilaceae bacterium Soc4.6]